MSAQTNADLISALSDSLDRLRDAMTGLTEEDAGKKPAPDRWCVLECLEHLAMAEEAMLGRIKNGEVLPEAIHQPVREAAMAATVAGRAARVQAPPHVHPTGRVGSLEVAMARMSTARLKTIEFVESCDDLRFRQATHPLFGPISGYEMAAIIASHSVRHTLQIREIRAAIG